MEQKTMPLKRYFERDGITLYQVIAAGITRSELEPELKHQGESA